MTMAAGLRIGALVHYQSDLNADPDTYLALAQQLADFKGYSNPYTGEPTAFRPPLYPLLLTPFSHPDWPVLRAVLQGVLSLLMFPFVWLAGRHLGLSLKGQALALLLLAVDPLLLRYVPFPMTETLCSMLIAVLIWRLTRPFPEHWVMAWCSAYVTGMCFALCVLARPTFWAFGGIVAGFLLLHWLLTKLLKHSVALQPSSALNCFSARLVGGFLGVVLVMSPWVIRNIVSLGSPIVMTTHGGYTLLLGNNDAFYKEVVNQPFGTIWDGSKGPGQAAWADHISQQMQEEGIVGELQRDRWQSQLAWQTMSENRETFWRAAFLKFCWFWNVAPHASASPDLNPSIRSAVTIYYSVVWLLLLVGILQILRKFSWHRDEFRRWACPLLLLVSLTGAHLFYWSDARMRAPIMPAIALLAAASIGIPRACKSSAPKPQ